MKGFLILIVGQLIVLGCGQNNSRIESPRTDSLTENKTTAVQLIPKISLDNFTEMPAEIEGCSCSYSESEESYQRNQYLFVCGFDSSAFVSIDGQLLKLKLISTGREPNSFGDYDHVDIYKTENYKITLDIKYKDGGDEDDESWYNNGTIKIEDKNGQNVTLPFFGSCGC